MPAILSLERRILPVVAGHPAAARRLAAEALPVLLDVLARGVVERELVAGDEIARGRHDDDAVVFVEFVGLEPTRGCAAVVHEHRRIVRDAQLPLVVGKSVELGEGLVRVFADLMTWNGDEAIELGGVELENLV